MNIFSFNFSVLLVYNINTVTVVFPPLLYFLCLAFRLLLLLLLLDLGASGTLDSCLSSIDEGKGSCTVFCEESVINFMYLIYVEPYYNGGCMYL